MFPLQIRTRNPPSPQTEVISQDLKFDPNTEYRRKGVTLNMETALKVFNIFRPDCFDEGETY